ncbi:TonB-dependent receptor [Mucilaginibacter sp. HC2]|uniref:SusC/RagA family TonB-linked outer membrane protein n=1 Tax=Mucilaginibacter inviolabilis TaxID=2714892 RepID=UPI00140C319D|nr:TonB-dependent receptor [Mucilaginibacter inviolabilis]NHA03719.1 TonB-dependent receptor [Mucilaginibacter inviolabilis]
MKQFLLQWRYRHQVLKLCAIHVWCGLIFTVIAAPLTSYSAIKNKKFHHLPEEVITGVVTSKGQPLPGVTIAVKGIKGGSVTDATGHFTIKASTNDMLIFSMIGFVKQEVLVGGKTNLSIELVEDSKSLNEVVVVGYGTQTRKDLTSSVASVKGEEIARVPVTNLDAALQGKVAGVQVVQNSGAPGDETYIRIRGNGSLFGENRPLYVIDGVPMNNIPAGVSPLGGDGQRITATNDINPNDVESIEVLKDAAATAIYGSRAAAGVILITTKKGKAGRARFNFNAYTGVATVKKRLSLLNADQYVDLITEERANANLPVDPAIVKTGTNTNWQDAIFRNAPISEYNLSISGGDKNITHYLSLGYLDQTGTIVGRQHFKRFNGRINLEYKATDDLKIGISMNGMHSLNNRIDNSFSGQSVLANALIYNPNYPIYNADGSYYYDVNRRATNPVMLANNLRFVSIVDRYVGNIFGEYTILPNLKFRTSFGMDNQGIQDDRYQSTQINNQSAATGAADFFTQLLWLNENTLTYTANLPKGHSLSGVIGESTQVTSIRRIGAAGNTNATDLIEAITGFTNRTEASDYRSKSGLLSYFGRVNYNYRDRYLVQVAGRIDGSSRFGTNQKYGFFPTISGGWRISNESFMKNQTFIDDLKLRASIGVSGSQEGLGNDFPSLATYATGVNYGTEPGIAASTLSNKDLSWEATTQTNIGLDLSLFNSRINITVDAYLKQTNRLIFKLDLPYTSGFARTNGANIGKLQNKGIDINVSTDNIRGKFAWSTNYNMSFNRNKITDLPQLVVGDPSSSDFTESLPGLYGTTLPTSIYRVGEPVGSFFGYKSLGVNPATGNMIYQDTNGDGKINAADRVIIGNALPKFTGGFTNTFSYKGFDLSIFLYFSYGNQVYNQTRAILERMAGYNNGNTTTLNRWTPANTVTNVPKAVFNDPVVTNSLTNGEMSSRWVENGSFIRLKNITLNYNIPASVLKRLRIQSAKVFLSGQNLALWTKYSGYDPEAQNQSVKNSQLGIDYAVQPQPRTISAGINVSF